MSHASRQTPFQMVLVAAGDFIMGSTPEEAQPDPNYPEMDAMANSRPQRKVFVPDFFIDTHPVTNRQYKTFIDDTWYQMPSPQYPFVFQEYAWDFETRTYPAGLDEYPIVFVTWYDALAYCEWAGKRLPSEAEWEKAARGTDGRPFPWGWDTDFSEHCHVYPEGVNPGDSPREDLRSVLASPNGVSPYGCYDMLGNTREWVDGWYDNAYYKKMRARSPEGPRKSKTRWRITRGSDRFDPLPHVAKRLEAHPWNKDRGTGFRCAMS